MTWGIHVRIIFKGNVLNVYIFMRVPKKGQGLHPSAVSSWHLFA